MQLRPRSHILFYFITFSTRPPKKMKNCGQTKNFQPYFLIQTLKVHSSILSIWAKGGVVSGGPQGGSQSCKTPRNPLFGFLYVGKSNIYLGGCLRRQVSYVEMYTWITHVIYAAAALAGDDSPGRQCTKMSHVCVSQAYTCGVPNVVKNVRHIRKGD